MKNVQVNVNNKRQALDNKSEHYQNVSSDIGMQAARLHPIQNNADITRSRQSTAQCDQTIFHLQTSREIRDVQRYPPCGIL